MLEAHRINVTQRFEKENPGYELLTEGDSFFVKIDFNDVEGFDKLSDSAKKLFKIMYKRNNAAHGLDYKIRWIPKSVIEHSDHLEVHFTGKDWLHWMPNGEWY